MNVTRKTLMMLMMLALGAFALAGCSDDDDDNPMTPDMGNGAMLRVVHASPDAPAVDVWVNGGLVFENAPFEGITDFVAVPADTYNIKITAAGDADTVAFDADLNAQGLAVWYRRQTDA